MFGMCVSKHNTSKRDKSELSIC